MKKLLMLTFTIMLAAIFVGCGDEVVVTVARDPKTGLDVPVILYEEKPKPIDMDAVNKFIEAETGAGKPKTGLEARFLDPKYIQYAENTKINRHRGRFHLDNIKPGDIYFVVVLDDGTHYIATFAEEVLALSLRMDNRKDENDIITADNVERVLIDFDNMEYYELNEQMKSIAPKLIENLGYRAYDYYGYWNSERNWEKTLSDPKAKIVY